MNISKNILARIKKLFDSDDDLKIFISLIQPFLTFTTVTLAVLSLIISNRTLSYQTKFQETQKQSDMTFRFQQRFQFVITDLRGKLEKGEIRLDDYLYSYWGVQYDQYVMNKYDNILPESFDTWIGYRYEEWKKNDSIKYVDVDSTKYIKFRDGFERTVKSFNNKDFEDFFRQEVFTGLYKRKHDK